jgi:L-ribulose-5-phosphate 4-epimerase
MYEDLKQRVYEANMKLRDYGLAPFTWGNVSECSREDGVFAIKPSGVSYDELTPDKIVVVNFDGKVIDGDLKPSSDTMTHAVLYRKFPAIGGVAHSHSVNATAFAQAGYPIPPFGTTHADFAYGEIPCTRKMKDEEVDYYYEYNTGVVIVECFREKKLNENDIPACLVKNHGPFTWGKSAMEAVEHAATLEIVAEMAIKTLTVKNFAYKKEFNSMPKNLLDKHFKRKHGKDAYYGQTQNK